MSEYVTSHGHPFSEDTREKVGVIVYDSTGKILIVKGVGGKLSLPKGGRMRGETELEGAVREAWEETGLDLESLYYTLKTKLILRIQTLCWSKRPLPASTSARRD
jgi:8-oxo-dGTP pyrophosphatase MutT (NUDIX family)